jgi:AcrR family transcriptional regulator
VELETAQKMPEDPEDLAVLVAQYPHGRVPRELRRRQIVAVATELFVGLGFASASMDELARRVGVSKPVVYDLVGSKDELFHEIVTAESARLAGRVKAAVESEPELALRLRAGTLAFFRFIGERRAAWRSLMALSDTPITAELAYARRFHAEVVASLLADGAGELGAVFDSAVIAATAHAINGAIEALALWWHDHPETSPEALADLLTTLVAPGLVALAESSEERRNKNF